MSILFKTAAILIQVVLFCNFLSFGQMQQNKSKHGHNINRQFSQKEDFSEGKYKAGGSELVGAIEFLSGITPYLFQSKQEENAVMPELDIQELSQNLPHVLVADENGLKTIDYSGLTVVLLAAIKEQQELIKNQQDQISDLNQRLVSAELAQRDWTFLSAKLAEMEYIRTEIELLKKQGR